MTNNHDGGRRLICNLCNAASATHDKATTWAFLRQQLKSGKGWSSARGHDYCPECTKKKSMEAK